MSAEKTTAVKVKKPAAKKTATTAADLTSDYQVILSPVVTEKATNGSQFNQVTFRVLRNATKPVIKTAVERLFNVKVTAVNTHNRRGKTKRFKGKLGFPLGCQIRGHHAGRRQQDRRDHWFVR